MAPSSRFLVALTPLVVALTLFGCSSSDSGTNYDSGGGGGGNSREFISGDISGSGGSYQHVFLTAESVPYYCRYHGGPGGVGMSGVISVNAGGTPSLHTFTITNSTLPSAVIDVGDTVRWINTSGVTHTVESDN